MQAANQLSGYAPHGRTSLAGPALLRGVLLIDALTFLVAAALNLGAHIPLGFATLRFPVPTFQAGSAEVVIGATLLIAAITCNRAWAWVSFWASVVGIAFGLVFTAATRGPAFEVHLIMALIAVGLVGLLIRTRPAGGTLNAARPARSPLETAVGTLMVVAGLTLLGASAIHFGITVPLGLLAIHDPFPGARIPEGVLGLVMLAGATLALGRRTGSWPASMATTVATLLLSLYGLSVTARSGSAGDMAYHVTLIALLLAIVALLLTPAVRRGLPH